MSTSGSKPDLAAERINVPVLVATLRELLGVKLVAYLAGVQSTRDVREWAEGIRAVDNERHIEMFRVAYLAARLIADRDGPQVAQTWFQGHNPILDDQPPALLLRGRDSDDVGPKIMSAARQFVGA